jgi:hypothetical protein
MMKRESEQCERTVPQEPIEQLWKEETSFEELCDVKVHTWNGAQDEQSQVC